MSAERFDAIVIGTGQGGGPLAGALAKADWKTAIIECEHVGGTCVNVGCTPTKTMVASARVAHLARRAADYGVRTGSIHVDQEVVRQRKRDIVSSWRAGSTAGLERWDHLELIMGRGSFIDAHTVHVKLNDGGERVLGSDKIFINTGTRNQVPDIPGVDSVPYLDSTSVMELDIVPKHLIVVGGGYIGLEFGQMFRRFGSDVTIVERASRCLPREDPDICGVMSQILAEDGLRLVVDSQPSEIRLNNGRVSVVLRTPDGESVIEGSHLLVATGRRPNTDMLNLGAAGVRANDRGFVEVNERLETNVAGVYAIGDVKGGPAFTHISYDDYRVLRANLLENATETITGRIVPYTLFTDPQLGRVGLTETQARKTGRRIGVAKMPMSRVARAIEMAEDRGLMKVIVDLDSEQILGAAVLGIEGGEIASMLQIAMMGTLPFSALRNGIFAHPTLAESLNNLFATIESEGVGP